METDLDTKQWLHSTIWNQVIKKDHHRVRYKEHMNPSMAVKKRAAAKREISMDNVEILKSSARGEQYLPKLEALYIVQKNKQ